MGYNATPLTHRFDVFECFLSKLGGNEIKLARTNPRGELSQQQHGRRRAGAEIMLKIFSFGLCMVEVD